MTTPEPGWYADPTGEAGRLRWWDGTMWVEAWTSDPTTPPPTRSVSPTPAGTVVPPPEGAPGPSYVLSGPSSAPQSSARSAEPAAGQRGGPASGQPSGASATSPPPATLTGADATRKRLPRELLLTVAVAGLVLAVVAAGGYLLFGPDGSSGASEDSDASVSGRSPAGPGRSGPPRQQPGQLPRLAYTPLGGDWQLAAGIGVVRGGITQRQVVEPHYDGGKSWVASVGTGRADPQWYDPNDLRASAQQLTARFARQSFRGTDIDRETRKLGTYNVDGRPGYLLQQRFTFQVPKLQTDAEMVTVVVVDLGQGRGGAFVASIPNSKPELLADAEQAQDSLTVRN